jgi:hypothetical protein
MEKNAMSPEGKKDPRLKSLNRLSSKVRRYVPW